MEAKKQSKFKQWQNSGHWIFFRSSLLIAITFLFYFHTTAQQQFHKRIHHYRDYYPDNPIPQKTLPSQPIEPTKTNISIKTNKEKGEDWPEFRGKYRDAICNETGLLQKWPQGGPKKILTISKIGRGYSSPVISNGRLLITGVNNKRSVIYCFSTDGKSLWQQDNGPVYMCSSFPGTRSTATVEENKVYVLSAIGRISVFKLDSGKKLWSRNILKDFAGPLITYGLAESPLVYKNKLICSPGGSNGEIVALDKVSGETLWTSKGTNDAAGYGSPLMVKFKGQDLLLTTLHHFLVGIDPGSGQQLWRYSKPFMTGRICMTPVISKKPQGIFLMGGEQCGGGAIQLQEKNGKIGYRELWHLPKVESHLGGYVIIAGKIYGADGRGWSCRDFETGKLHYRIRKPRRCSTIFADNRFICCETNGIVYLIEANHKQARVVSRFRMPEGRLQVWTRPVISHKRLYLRFQDQLHVYDIKRQ